MSPVVNFFLSEGVPIETVQFLLMFPIVATFIAFLRQVVGIKAFGIYTPAIITFAFLVTGIKYGIAIFVSVIFIGMMSRFILRKLRLLYLPRLAITLSIVAISILVILAIGGYFQRTGLAAVSIFPILIMITIVEKFVAAQIEKGGRAALLLASETLLISIAGYFILNWKMLVNFLLIYPWMIFLVIPINILLGRWTGLRISEYIRFRDVIKKI